MSQPVLSYQPSGRPALQASAWIYVLALGSLYLLGSTVAGVSCAVSYPQLKVALGPTSMNRILLLYAVMILYGLGIGITYFWSALRLRHGSRPAALTIFFSSLLNTLALLALAGLSLSLLGRGIFLAADVEIEPAFSTVLFFSAIGVSNGVANVLIVLLLRRMPPKSFGATP